MMQFYRCGGCGARFNTEKDVVEHADANGHAGPWSACTDEIAIVARDAIVDGECGDSWVPWSFFGRWRFSDDCDPGADESIGFTVRHLLRHGCVEVRVMHLRDAQVLYESTKPKKLEGE